MNSKIWIFLSLVSFLFSAEDNPSTMKHKDNLSCALSNGELQGCTKSIKSDKSAVNILLSHQRELFNASLSVGAKKSNHNYLTPLDSYGEDFSKKDFDLGYGLKLLNEPSDSYYETLVKGDYLSDESKRTAFQGGSIVVKKGFNFSDVFHKVDVFFRRLFF